MGLIKDYKRKGLFTAYVMAGISATMAGERYFYPTGNMGISSYYLANLLVSIFAKIVPKLYELQKEGGAQYQEKVRQVTKRIAYCIAAIQHYISNGNCVQTLLSMLYIESAEKINEKGLGNGYNLMFTTQILFDLQKELALFAFTPTSIATSAMLLAPMLVSTFMYFQAEFKIPVITEKKINYLPLRPSVGGIMPLAYGFSVLYMFPNISWWLYTLLIVFFYVLSVEFNFNTYDIAKQLKSFKQSISHIRPGIETKTFLEYLLHKAILFGIPLILVLALYPKLLIPVGLFSIGRSIPLIYAQTAPIVRTVKGYHLSTKYSHLLSN